MGEYSEVIVMAYLIFTNASCGSYERDEFHYIHKKAPKIGDFVFIHNYYGNFIRKITEIKEVDEETASYFEEATRFRDFYAEAGDGIESPTNLIIAGAHFPHGKEYFIYNQNEIVIKDYYYNRPKYNEKTKKVETEYFGFTKFRNHLIMNGKIIETKETIWPHNGWLRSNPFPEKIEGRYYDIKSSTEECIFDAQKLGEGPYDRCFFAEFVSPEEQLRREVIEAAGVASIDYDSFAEKCEENLETMKKFIALAMKKSFQEKVLKLENNKIVFDGKYYHIIRKNKDLLSKNLFDDEEFCHWTEENALFYNAFDYILRDILSED